MIKDEEPNDYPQKLPVVILDDMFLYPFMIAPIFFDDEQNLSSIDYAIKHDKQLVVVVKKENKNDFYDIAIVGSIMRKVSLPENKIKILFKGDKKCTIEDITKGSPLIAKVDQLKYKDYDRTNINILLNMLKEVVLDYHKLEKSFPYDIIDSITNNKDPNRVMDLISSILTMNKQTAYELFKQTDANKRVVQIIKFIKKEISAKKLQLKVANEVSSKIHSTNEKHFIKEQIKNLQEKLGETDKNRQKADKFSKKLKKIKKFINKDAFKESKKIVQRYYRLHQDSPDSSILETYLEYLFDIPFGKFKKNKISIDTIEKQLDKDHYSLTKPKNRIVEFFAVKQLLELLKKKSKKTGTIICFVGPPGVGKTSLANSISKAIKRPLLRIALGGLEDVNELRGHRRTYVGAMPGRIVQGLISAKYMNPVVVLDEIDKIRRTGKGDPTAVMLEILDPQQNNRFRDLYMNFDIDLSSCLFIATANTKNTIPPALRDRMEFITLNSYTPYEKFHIASNYLIPQEKDAHGVGSFEINISANSIKDIIDNYTAEAGVRNLRRVFQKLFRKIAKQYILNKKRAINITKNNLAQYLDKPIFELEKIKKENTIGLVNGLAWTAVGGDTLKIEAVKTKGKGVLSLTGSLGDVMKESAKISFWVVKVILDQKQNDTKPIYQNWDIHIHIPSGATPKDGPSAGISMATAILSILTDKKVRQDVAMTGELSLKGDVLPIGGLKEKLIAAYKVGIKIVIIPEKNYKNDLDDMPKEVLKSLDIRAVNTIDEVIDIAFE